MAETPGSVFITSSGGSFGFVVTDLLLGLKGVVYSGNRGITVSATDQGGLVMEQVTMRALQNAPLNFASNNIPPANLALRDVTVEDNKAPVEVSIKAGASGSAYAWRNVSASCCVRWVVRGAH